MTAGILIMWATYSAAGSGGTFVVGLGAIVFGAYRYARGFYYLGDPARLRPPTSVEAAKHVAKRATWVGLATLAAGILITLATYAAAGSGGTFAVGWGAIVFGAYRYARGFYDLGNPARLLKKVHPNS